MARKTTTQRGYGHRHQTQRKRWQHVIDQGEATCVRCHQPISPYDPWDLDHTDDREDYLGPAHPTCNRSAGGVKGAASQQRQRRHTVRAW